MTKDDSCLKDPLISRYIQVYVPPPDSILQLLEVTSGK